MMFFYHAGFIITKSRVFWSRHSDEHDDIIVEKDLTNNIAGQTALVRAKMTPPPRPDGQPDLGAPLDQWRYRVDQDALPNWYTNNDEKWKAEVQAALADWYPTKVYLAGTHEVRDKEAYCAGKAVVLAFGNASVEAWDSAHVQAHDATSVSAHDRADIQAYDQASIWAYDQATVKAHNGASVEAFDHATIQASQRASVRAFGTAVIEASGKTTVWASDGAVVRAYNTCLVEAFGKAFVEAFDAATVWARDNTVVRAAGSSNTVLFDAAEITLAESAAAIDRRGPTIRPLRAGDAWGHDEASVGRRGRSEKGS